MAFKCPETLGNKGLSGIYVIKMLKERNAQMFGNQNKKTELIIVCDDRAMQYAKYLVQLISRIDDEEGVTIGTKDETVTAAIWTEKNYKDSLAKITSNTHILFVGKNKTTLEEAKFVDFKMDCFGMRYGWQGKRAVMYVYDEVENDEYDSFIEYTKKYQIEYQKEEKNAKEIATKVAAWLLAPGIAPAIYETIKEKESVKEQQYRCLTLVMYLEGLQSFLEE